MHRLTRGVTPTEAGTPYCERCKAIERAIDEAENQASQVHRGAGGLLRISTSVAFGRRRQSSAALRGRETPALPLQRTDHKEAHRSAVHAARHAARHPASQSPAISWATSIGSAMTNAAVLATYRLNQPVQMPDLGGSGGQQW